MKQEGIAGVGPSMEQSTAETLDIGVCLTSGFCEGYYQCWRNRVILWNFKTFYSAAFPPPQKTLIIQNRISNALN
jgi:hypothetical protein